MSRFLTFKFEDAEISIPKSDISFSHGYGVFEAKYVKIDEKKILSLALIGVVDKDYNILNLVPKYVMPKIAIFPGDIFVYHYNSNEDYENPSISLYREKYPNLDETECDDLGPCDFKVINDEVIMFDGVGNGNRLCALYNVVTREALTPYFNYFGEFKESMEYGRKVAEAVALIKDDKGNIINEIYTTIDEFGTVLTSYKDRLFGLEFDGDRPLIEVIEEVNKVIRGR